MAVAPRLIAQKYVGNAQKVKHTVRLIHFSKTASEENLKKDVRNYCEKYKYRLGAVRSNCMAGHPKIKSTNAHDSASDGRREFDCQDVEDYFWYSESFCQSRLWDFKWVTKNNKTLGANSKAIFGKGYETLEKYAENEPLTPQENVAISALTRFFSEKGKHEESLKSLRTKKLSETGVASLLSQHFLGQLLPHPTNFCIDKHSLGKTAECPCGCNKQMKFGLTAIGSPELFYGSADIVLFPSQRRLLGTIDDVSTAAVFTVNRSRIYEQYGHVHSRDDGCREYDIREEGITTGECMKDVLDSATAERQLFKQAISLSLCKQKGLKNGQIDMDSKTSACIVPVCGISSSTYDIVMYDADNDYLLKMFEDEPEIFDGDELIFSTVMDIWMVIYHGLFCFGPLGKVQEALHGSCGLMNQIGQRYESVLDNSRCFCRIDGPSQRSMGKPAMELLDVAEEC